MGKRYIDKYGNFWDGTSIVLEGMRIFNPSEEQIFLAGYEEYIEPAPTPEQLLERAKASKIAELEAYDSSEEVNSFRVNIGNEAVTAWFTPEQRADYKNSIDAAELLGRDVVRPVINGREIELPVSVAKTALAQIQLYANQCYGVTEKHKAAINALETVEEVDAYDFERFYPEKLVFNVDAL